MGIDSTKLQALDFQRFATARVLVVGDVMLDRYWFGVVDRISPEAPVPIVKIERTEERPGGAANVARNAAALRAQVTLLSVIGADDAGHRLEKLLVEAGVVANLHVDESIETTVKLRVIGRQQQLLRIDFETTPSHEVLLGKLSDYERALEDCNIVVLSDYGKGGLTHISQMITMARSAGRPVLVDPKGGDYSKYQGATVVTPNRPELREVIGCWSSEADLIKRAQALRERLEMSALLLTRSEEGMTLFEKDGVFNEPANAREVFDVSGAGDTVIATLGVMLGAGLALHDAVRIANCAAGVVVGKLGAAVVYPEELLTISA
ncbi:MAG: D-glycero-beta-D-manno-heptose-7-phosphate kinase [Betaproteobacteria bacterium]|nr:D-glycero-beta-D-manno-heptose-7-phosphate kinase [Betaproteobacteria bacterium]